MPPTGGTKNAAKHYVSATDFIIPDSVTSIGYNAFYNCSSLNIKITINITPDCENSQSGVLFKKNTVHLKSTYYAEAVAVQVTPSKQPYGTQTFLLSAAVFLL